MVDPAVTADSKFIDTVLLAVVAVQVVATDWCKQVPPLWSPIVGGIVTTTLEFRERAFGMFMMKL